MLRILDEVPHSLVHMTSNRPITPLDAADTTLARVSLLVMVAAVRVTLTPRDILPQLNKLDGLVDISAHLIAIEEVGMDAATTAFTDFGAS